ncbi:polysaccharide pyruvyl transferase family protein [Desemzia sp. FAM 23990]|uniref:polysaccharide pyruvyl transferase family protein n=1 Tax=Desemzia sp. FAM 23990 TaxID=3259520 RepID=UPI003889C724
MRIAFISRYGSNNLGDQLIVREFEELLNSFSDNLLRFDNSLNYYNSFEEAFDTEKKSNSNSGKPSVIKEIYKKYFRKNKYIATLRNQINKRRAMNNPNLLEFEKKLQNIDLLIIGGGNAIYDLEKHSDSAFYYKIIFDIVKKTNIPIFMIGVGIGPFMTLKQRDKTINVLKSVDYITVRDKKSFEAIKDLNKDTKKVFQTIDPVLFLENNQTNVINDVFGISVMDIRLSEYSESDYSQYLNQLAHITRQLINSGFSVDLFCSETADLIALKDLQKLLNKEANLPGKISFYNEVSLLTLREVYNRIDFLLGTRMHTLIIAFSQNIPFIGINWQTKVREFSKIVELDNYVLSMEHFLKNINMSFELINKLIVNYDLIKEKNAHTKKELEKELDINSEIIRTLINSKQ